MLLKPFRKAFQFRKYRLLAPGPVPLHPKVQKELAKPMIHHRTPEFEACLASVLSKLKLCFKTSEPVMIHASTGSGAMESAIVNTLSPDDEVIAVVSGKFGERWAKIAGAYGVKAHILEVPWGEAVTVAQIDSALARHPRSKAVLCQACETSTATAHPIREIAALLRSRKEVLFMVDAITAIGAMPLPMDEWGIDVVVSGSQKAFMLPTGISFIALSKKAWGFHASAKCPRYYWDLKPEKAANEKQQSFFSSAVSHVRALNIALDSLSGPALERTIARTEKMAKLSREAVSEMGLQVYSKAPASAVTAILLPENISGEKLRDHIEKKYSVTLMGGQDQLKDKILRMGHLGFIEDNDLSAGIEAIGLALIEFGYANIDRKKLKTITANLSNQLKASRGKD